MIQGEVFNIQRYCMNDGPGIRTAVFMKGCPLNCLWCHNPESRKKEPQILCRTVKCRSCGQCAMICPMQCHRIENGKHVSDFSDCILCGRCVEDCLPGALEIVGRKYTAEEVIQIVKKDRAFYDNSGGGMTVTGGEPFMQPEFLLELLKLAKEENIHTAIETCGFVKPEILESVLDYTDLFLFDYKETDPERHDQYTGVYPQLILQNLDFLGKVGKDVILRCPIIPGYNDREDHFRGIAATADRYENIKRIDVEPYHNLGVGKKKGLGLAVEEEIPVPDTRTAELWRKQIAAMCQTEVK